MVISKTHKLAEWRYLAAVFVAVLLARPTIGRADMVFLIVPGSPTAAIGSTNNFFEIDLVNNGGNTPNSSNVAATSFDLKTANANIVFTSATTLNTVAP